MSEFIKLLQSKKATFEGLWMNSGALEYNTIVMLLEELESAYLAEREALIAEIEAIPMPYMLHVKKADVLALLKQEEKQ